MSSDRPASWRMPSPKQMEKLASRAGTERPARTDDDAWWDSVLSDPLINRETWVPIQNRRLSEIPRETLRVECIRCLRIVEIARSTAMRLYGRHAVWKDVGSALLEDGCKHRTGWHEQDGCWIDWGMR